MSVARSDKSHTAVAATDLLVYDEGQLIDWLKAHHRGDHYDISSLDGFDSLGKSQKDDLGQKICQATKQLPFGVDDLTRRLQDVADTRADCWDLAPPRLRSESLASTVSLPPTWARDFEMSCRQELIRDGGRAVCSMEELSDIRTAPMARYEELLPWLTDEPDTEIGAAEIKTIFSEQLRMWWKFRRSQWVNRGIADTETGFRAFLESNKRVDEGAGNARIVHEPSFDEAIRGQWQRMRVSRAPESQTFSAYHKAIKIRLAPYHLTPSLQLRKDPQKQTPWTDWLEYLCFELRHLESLTLTAESLETRFDQSMRRLLETKQPNTDHAVTSSAAPDFTHSRQCLGAKGINATKELAEAQADRDATRKLIDNFTRETRAYTRARRAAYYQRHRVAWVLKEARLMETEMSLKSSLTKSKKRKQGDEDLSESQPKRTKRERGGRNATSVAPPGKTYPRRSSRQTKGLNPVKA